MRTRFSLYFLAALTALLLAQAGCDRSPQQDTATAPVANDSAPAGPTIGTVGGREVTPFELYDNYTETGDLPAIEKRGKLRLLVDPSRTAALPREATQQDVEIEQARAMARQLGLELVILQVETFDELIKRLNAGEGDLIANNLLITEDRRQLVDFSEPTAETRIVLVSAAGTAAVRDGQALDGKTLVVTRGTAFEAAAQKFAGAHPGLRVEVRDTNYIDLLVEVADGEADFTIVDQLALELVQQFRDDLKANVEFPEEQQLAWAIRKNSPELLGAINKQVRQLRLTRPGRRSIGDLDTIRERGVLRAVTRNHPGTYFMWRGQILGFEFNLLENFANSLGVRLDIIVADNQDDFVRILRDGDADISASLLAITKTRKAADMAFSTPYLESVPGIASRPDEQPASLQDLAGRTVCVRPGSSQYEAAQELRQQVPQVKLEEVSGTLDIQQVLDKVVAQECDLAIADEISVRLEQAWQEGIQFALPLPREKNRYAWMVRKSNPQLLAAINDFFAEPHTDDKLPDLYERYFNSPKRTRPEIEELNRKGEISPFDDIVRRYAEEFGFDWRLIVAQMYQESNFNPKAKSWVGARGLMQVMPNTGKQVGETNLFDPESSIRAGIKYMRWLHDKFDDKGITPENQLWFTLASYNAGLGHVYDAQELAEKKGWDRRIWFDNVERAMLLLAEPEFYQHARYGYARGQEPVDYVRKIDARFRHFAGLLDVFQRKQARTSTEGMSFPVTAAWQGVQTCSG
ncbi:Membrane-bound lytic murein transglycosylase F precursor [Microbulbifer aggregans]|uniref:Membrane-bound lytic murein transglycosylase F n=1 Tax=Microbulbifer aggregans TaxID=1769779 RepID=A0A1C9W770_9GAMM|nr:transporter substrate-binding domain-containing protein [Microbulbifer aggregans]AOS96989.1 Membrane-bound lytic murein transglycosylase F precursor [Microbulbifer aggregans]